MAICHLAKAVCAEVDVKTFRAGIGPVANIQKIATKKTHAPGYFALHLSRQNLKPRTVLGPVVLKTLIGHGATSSRPIIMDLPAAIVDGVNQRDKHDHYSD